MSAMNEESHAVVKDDICQKFICSVQSHTPAHTLRKRLHCVVSSFSDSVPIPF